MSLKAYVGTGESGKSTIAKQMKIIHLDGFTDEERKLYTNAIHNNVYLSLRSMIQAAHQISIDIPSLTPVHFSCANRRARFLFFPLLFLSPSLPSLENFIYFVTGDFREFCIEVFLRIVFNWISTQSCHFSFLTPLGNGGQVHPPFHFPANFDRIRF